MQHGLFRCRNVSETGHDIVVVVAVVAVVVVVVVVVDRFYIALFSALEQTHCAHVSCDSK